MKKTLMIVCALGMLTAAGCSQEDAGTGQSGVDVDIVVTVPASDEMDADSETSVSEEETAEVSSEAIQTETQQGTAPSEEAEQTENVSTSAAGSTNEALIGDWQYTEYWILSFHEDGSMTVKMDYTEVMSIENGTFKMGEVSSQVKVSGDHVFAEHEGETVLSMTAADGTDAASLNGRYSLEPCSVRSALSEDAEESLYMILENDRIYVETNAAYNVENSVLWLNDEGNMVPLHYYVEGDELHLIDQENTEDILTRCE